MQAFHELLPQLLRPNGLYPFQLLSLQRLLPGSGAVWSSWSKLGLSTSFEPMPIATPGEDDAAWRA